MKDTTEYLRRNLVHAKAAGAYANALAIRRRLPKSTPLWLRDELDGIIERLHGVGHELASHRDEMRGHEP